MIYRIANLCPVQMRPALTQRYMRISRFIVNNLQNSLDKRGVFAEWHVTSVINHSVDSAREQGDTGLDTILSYSTLRFSNNDL